MKSLALTPTNPDIVQLLRYFAIKFNRHRIHYDRNCATEVVGYPGLAVHSPFTTQCLLDLVRDLNPENAMKTFDMRARIPIR